MFAVEHGGAGHHSSEAIAKTLSALALYRARKLVELLFNKIE